MRTKSYGYFFMNAKFMKSSFLFIILLLLFSNCEESTSTEQKSPENMKKTLTIKKEIYGTQNDTTVHQYTLTNANGMEVRIIEFGGIVTHLFVPDKNGETEDVVLGFDRLEQYVNIHPYFGALIGRYGNRIANGRFVIDEQVYQVGINEKSIHHLHGGKEGFDKRIWSSESFEEADRVGVKLRLISPDGDQGYPGNLEVEVIYSLNDKNELGIDYQAITDKATPVNLTNHAYFNLNGAGNEGIEDQELMIDADRFTPVNSRLIPTGELANVADTPFDFRTAKSIGKEIESDHPQMTIANTYDHNFLFTSGKSGLALRASVYEPNSGRKMEVLTTEPGVQLYVANYNTPEKEIVGKSGKTYKNRAAYCLETQHFPDSPNQTSFPSTILRPDETYRSETVYRFLTE